MSNTVIRAVSAHSPPHRKQLHLYITPERVYIGPSCLACTRLIIRVFHAHFAMYPHCLINRANAFFHRRRQRRGRHHDQAI